MIEKGMKVTISIVDAQKVHVLGTPEELKEFLLAEQRHRFNLAYRPANKEENSNSGNCK